MPSLRVLTVDLADLNLETDVINGAKVEISIERTTTFDSFVIAPSLDYKATSDETGILTFNILPSDANTVYRASVIDASGKQVLSSVFVMPDSDANLAELLELTVFPDGMNVPDKNIGFLDYRLNGVSIGSPMLLKTINIVSDGLASFDAGTGVLTINLHPKSGESLILRGSGAPAPETGNNGDLYYDSTGKTFYEKSGGAWSKSGSLVPAGPGFVFSDATGGATLSDGGATVTFPSATGHAVNSGFAAFSGKVAVPFRLNSDLPDGAIVNVGLQVSPNYADWVWNGAVALIEYNDPDPDANLVLNDHNVSCARSGEFCLLVDIDARTSSIIIPGGTTVLGSTSPVAACGYPVVELASGTYPGGVTLLTSSSYSLPSGYVVITAT